MILEICANSLESALAAQKAGAHRIELCTALSLGGLTPTYGLIEQAKARIKLPIMVLIRPRSGDFTYSALEWEVILRDIEICKELGVEGIVCGALTENKEIDRNRTQQLLECSSGMDFTFHRAFDWTPNPYKSLDLLIALGVPRVLTSGQEVTAEKGLPLLKKLQEQAEGKIAILPGGGVKASNVHLFKEGGFSAVHCSASNRIPLLTHPLPVPMENHLEEGVITRSAEEKIREILKQLS